VEETGRDIAAQPIGAEEVRAARGPENGIQIDPRGVLRQPRGEKRREDDQSEKRAAGDDGGDASPHGALVDRRKG